jgi:uncharacterized protein YdaU (DUF1376 family)
MAELPRLPVDCAKILADTTYMSEGEFGAYCRILFTMWLQGGRLPDDAHELAHIAGVTPRRWKIIADRVRRPYTSAGGQLSQKRLTATWQEVQELRRVRASAANARWNAKPRPPHMQKHSTRNPISNIKEESISSSESVAAPARDADAPQGDSRGYQVVSPQLQQQLKGKR